MNQEEQPQEIQNNPETQEQPQSLLMDNYPVETPEPPADEIQDEEVQEVETPVATTPEEQPTQPAPTQETTQRVEDPGEFKPNDYSFDVELADGKKIHISKPEDFAQIPQDADFGSPKNFMDVQANYYKMVNGLDSDQKSHQEAQEAFSKQADADKQAEERVQTLLNEFDYLETSGDLPAVPAQYQNADWSDPEIAKQPGVKERIELINFRKEENDKRVKVGLPPIGILETKTLMENKAFKEAAAQREQKQTDLRKKRSAMVGAPSAPVSGSQNADMIVGSGGSLRDIG